MPVEEFPDTVDNRGADGAVQQKRPDLLPPSGSGNVNGLQITGPQPQDQGLIDALKTDAEWLNLVKAAKSSADQYLATPRKAWADAYRAYRNQHHDKSTYNSERWRGRSKYHVPKTRTAVHKGDASAAAALFTSADIIDVSASNPGDPADLASAEINKELVANRLDRKSGRAGLPWFQVAIGAHNDCQLTGLACAKIHWDRRDIPTMIDVPVMMPAMDPMTGQPQMDQQGQPAQQPVMDPVTGQPMTQQQPSTKIIRDRPMIRLFPMELVLRDPGADWLDQAQESSFLGLMHPMRIGDAEAFMKANPKSSVQWRKVDRSALVRASQTPTDAQGVTNAREGSTAERTQNKLNVTARDFDTTWLIEWFIRREGREWHFWTSHTDTLLSDPAPVEVAYPHLDGERPVVIGTGIIEPHKIDPVSKVAGILPLQQEINDLRNTRLDGIKETLRPLVQIRRGSNIDPKALQNRSGDSAIMVPDVKESLSFDRPGSIGGEAFMEGSNLSAEFDDMAGQMNNSTVMNSRQLNETVGGMKQLGSAANVIQDFDLRVFLETWVEPVLRQIVRLEQYYEDDETILMLAGEKAQLYEKYGMDQITDDLLNREVTVTVSAGIGNADPKVKMENLAKAGGLAASFLGPEIQARAKQDAIIDELFGLAGFKGAAERFFYEGDGQDPRISGMKDKMKEMAGAIDDKQADRDNKIEIARISAAQAILVAILAHQQQMQAQQIQHEQNMQAGAVQHGQNMQAGNLKHGQALQAGQAKHQQGMQAADSQFGQALQQKGIDHAHDLHKSVIGGAQKSQQIQQGAQAKMNGHGPPQLPAPASNGAVAPPPSGLDPALIGKLLMAAFPTIMPNTPLPDVASMGSGGGGMGGDPSMGGGGMGGSPGQPPGSDKHDQVMQQLMQHQQMMMQMMQQLASSHASVGQGLSQLAQAHSMPKMIMKDEQGRPVGTRPMLPQ